MKKYSIILLIAAICVASVFSQAASEKAVKTKTIKLGTSRADDHPTTLGAKEFARIIEEKTGGMYKVEVYPNDMLGNDSEMFAQLKTGDLEMCIVGINTLAFISGGEALEITAIPFLYRDYEHMRKCLLSDSFKPALEQAEKNVGFKILNISGDTAPRGLTCNKKVLTPDDFKGIKIRTAASETVMRTMKTLGALPQQIPLADVWMALKTGVVDAQENGAISSNKNSFFEVQKYYMKTDYIRDIETFYISNRFYNSLSAEEKIIFHEASEAAGELITKLNNEQLESVFDELKEKGMEIITEPELRLDMIRVKLEGLFNDWDGVKWPKGMLVAFKNM